MSTPLCGHCDGEIGDHAHDCNRNLGSRPDAPAIDTGALHRAPLGAEIERLTGELARERAMRASTGCACPTPERIDFAMFAGHVAGCPAMESGRLRAERDHYQAQARTFFDFGARKGAEANHWHAVALATREAARCESTVYTTAMLAAVEAAFREPPKGTDG